MLARNKQLNAFKFDGFWYAMDTLRDKIYLEDLWNTGKAPWKTWNE
jgi:glucose-1-phosphate cytidylyltransferase